MRMIALAVDLAERLSKNRGNSKLDKVMALDNPSNNHSYLSKVNIFWSLITDKLYAINCNLFIA
jgi:hypothetical protein